MKIWSAALLVLFTLGCGDDAKKSATNPNNANNTTNNANNTTNNANNTTNNGSLVVDVTQFDQTCDFDGHCAAVNPAVCSCGCPTAGINVDELDAFTAAAGAIECPNTRPDLCAECIEILPVCQNDTCGVREAYYVNAEDYDNSCETAEDCMYIATGEICSDCQCAATPVNRQSYEDNPPPNVDCRPGPQVCDCASPPAIACIDNICQFGG